MLVKSNRAAVPLALLESLAIGLCFHFATGVRSPEAREQVRLLGPCFKTGRVDSRSRGPRAPPDLEEFEEKEGRRLRTATGRPDSTRL